MRGAIKDANVSRFSGGGPPREGPMITSVSPETTSLTVPRNHPVAMMVSCGQTAICQCTTFSIWQRQSVGL